MKKVILSGMRPTGKLHLGHLAGALDNWVKLQKEYQCFFMVADWHALMSEYENTSLLSENIIDNVVDWLSVGIDPKESVIFIQSKIPEHLNLHMIFSCLTPLGILERCPTYKEQLREVKTRDLNTYGFLGYPVLQAADILLYKADKVPVGRDQLPHLELTREIARLFNNLYKKDIFPYPDAILTQTPKLLGLDGRKMSKSYANTINLSDPPQVITKKISTMFTDPKRIKLTDQGHPNSCNVFSYYTTFIPGMKDEVYSWCIAAKKGCTDCKKILAENIIDKISPIQRKREELCKDIGEVRKIILKGNNEAQSLAAKTMKEVSKAVNI
ncbi:MAG: tryptophan--tRNA ligase [Candidatus Omnitrophota bacterium]|jgi:tryptophanyl-tRNA synthetase|nr:tryptophan--tRNA ligase [Candidatus Omnitrophota bacterium]MDD4981286.1 tryptophan--tRNA ligase [Candidatus Omnitrophota bacterium]MDD5664573.1 tryptophan--tRNA ligase [Candidatus Omnitrophota bacterium]